MKALIGLYMYVVGVLIMKTYRICFLFFFQNIIFISITEYAF